MKLQGITLDKHADRPGSRNPPKKKPGEKKKTVEAVRQPSKPKKTVEAATLPATPIAGPAAMKFRHYWLVASFVFMVLIPTGIGVMYLQIVAADQYASTVGFSVRKAEGATPADLLGGIVGVSSSGGSSDTDVLYEYIQSQNLVSRIDKQLDLRAIYSKPDFDPVFAFDPNGSIEDLLDYWGRMIKIHYDAGTGLIEIRVNAFDPNDAQDVALAIFRESSIMINRLSAIARDDATRYSKLDLDEAVSRLKVARQAVTEFRSRTQIVDPSADIQGQMGLLNMLQQQQAQALIELDLLRESLQPSDPRIEQASRKISVIEVRIAEERRKFGVGSDGKGDQAYASLISEYEGLVVEREFAERSYLAALTAFDSAKAEAQRQSRYLAAYVEPTLAETAEYPKRVTDAALIAMFLFLSWSILSLIFYSIKDRR
ncbi:MAG: sugar transporter [Paracoccaceae bacterium]